VFNNYSDIQSQVLHSFEKKKVINNLIPLEFYSEYLKKYMFYASGKPKQFWGFFLCNFENNELKYEEIKASLI
jgi:hypothetical protein